MCNQLRFFAFQYLYVSSFIQEKVSTFRLFKNNIFYTMRFHFLLKNIFSNRLVFLFLIMLLEKFVGNSIYFVQNKRILRNKFLRVGGFFEISTQKLYNYLCALFLFSFPKLTFEELSGQDVCFFDNHINLYNCVFFYLKKILFINFFTHSNDYDKYNHLFEYPMFQLKFRFGTCLKFYLFNRDILRLSGLNII